MASETTDSAGERGPISGLRDAFEGRFVVLLLAGVLAGYSVSLFGADVVSLPVVGRAPGPLVGAVGLAVAITAYRRTGCCGNCDQRRVGLRGDCGCSGSCGDSCSRDP